MRTLTTFFVTAFCVCLLHAQTASVSPEFIADSRAADSLPESPHSTRYFFGPTGYNLRTGQGYYQNAWLLVNQVTYGFSDNFSVGVGVVPLFLFGFDYSPVWVTPKFSVPIGHDKGAFGGGALLGGIPGQEQSGFGIVYGVGTVGSRDLNATLGLGYGYASGNWADRPVINFGGLWRTSRKWAVQTENYIINTDGDNLYLFSIGARWMGPSIAIDFGLVRPYFNGDSEGILALPWLSVTAPFGKKKRG